MGTQSNIQWTDATWNIARGCTKVDADCKFCYMYREGDRFKYNPSDVIKTKSVFKMPLKYEEKQSSVWNGPPLIFTSSLTDFWHEKCDSFRGEAEDIISARRNLIFQVLTKRIERVPHDWGDKHPNVWLGTSVGSIAGVDRIRHLVDKKATVRFVSFEPLHEDVTLHPVLPALLREVQWVIIGGESGNDTGKFLYRPCEIQWIKDLYNMAKAAGCAVFIKQMGTHLAKKLRMTDRHGGNMNEFSDGLRVREFPNVYK